MYYALHPEEFTCYVDQLRKQLEKIRDDQAAEKERFKQLVKSTGLAPKGKRGATDNQDGCISKKQRTGNGRNNSYTGGSGTAAGAGDGKGTAAGQGRKCALCAKWTPNNAHCHNTADCRIWNEDGSRKDPMGRGKRGSRYSNRHSTLDANMGAVNEAASQLAKLEIKLQKYKEKVRKAKKHKKRRRHRHGGYCSSSSSSSSSDR